MFFASNAPANLRHPAFSPAGLSLERFLNQSQAATRQTAGAVKQDETSYTLSFDVPGIAKEHLSIGLEGSIVRIETKEGAPRQYRQAYELPQDIDATTSEAQLENGVLTLRLVKQVPVSRVTQLNIR